MDTAHPDKTAPVGLTHFLAAHSSCDGDFDTLPGGAEITLRCQGCAEHFTYDTHANGFAVPNGSNGNPSSNGSTEQSGASAPIGFAEIDGGAREWVAEELTRMTTSNGTHSNGDTQAESPAKVGVTPATESLPPDEPRKARPRRISLRPSRTRSDKRVPPPGPYAPKRQSKRSRLIQEDVVGRLDALGRAILRRWRPVVLSGLALAGAYMVLVLSSGDEPSSSQPTGIGGSDIPAAPVQLHPGTPAPKAVRKGTTAAQKAVELTTTPQPQPGSP